MDLNQKKIGHLLIGLSIILILALLLVKAETDSRAAFLCKEISSNPNLDMAQCPAHEDNVSWLIFGLFSISLLILVTGIYLSFMPAKKPEPQYKKVDISHLPDDEKKVYNMIKHKDGSMYQSDIIKETELSKVAVTRILDKLEGRKLLERKRRGMTNIIILK